MIRKLSWLILLIVPVIYGCSQFYYQSPVTKFNHEAHVDILFQQKRDCFFCHKLPSIETMIKSGGQLKIAADLKIDGKCHSCHRDVPTKVASAPQNCSTCHENMKVLKPADHVNNWNTLHSVPAKLDSKSCETCHKQWYCESCHSKQNSLENYRHSRSFKLKHSLEATIDPGSCDKCHRVDFCITCHRKG
ncbi:cytochrome c3 family protein [Seleniivibrio woodruffii]|uniref:cytochrome c3 family protein n=1 Tax=Seleniivibrio woodruffii TaxID=1078050 RepID=UPI0024090C24|nr:cytochrome c3 family protein [Seleniivibrio woodruffii]